MGLYSIVPGERPARRPSPPAPVHARRASALLAVLVLLLATCVSPTLGWRAGRVEAGFLDSMGLQDVTSSVLPSGTSHVSLADSLRVLAQCDFLNTRRTGLLATQASDHDHRVLQLWQDDADDEPRLTRIWSSAPLPNTTGTNQPYIVSVVCADTLHRGVLDVVVQGSDGRLYFLDGTLLRLGASGHLPASGDAVLQVLPIDVYGESAHTVNVTVKDAAAPVISVATLRAPCHAPDIVFVNALDELVVLTSVTTISSDTSLVSGARATTSSCVYQTVAAASSTVSASQGSVLPVFEARTLVNNETRLTWRTDETAASAKEAEDKHTTATLHSVRYAEMPHLSITDPVSLALHDVNEDCGAELLFTISGVPTSDLNNSETQVYIAAYASPTNTVTLLLPLPQRTPDDAQALVYGTPLATDMNGDGLVDLVLPVRLSQEDAALAAGSFRRLHLFFNTRSNETAYLGGNCAETTSSSASRVLLGIDASSTTTLAAADCGVPMFTHEESTMYTFTTTDCGVVGRSVADTQPLAFTQLQTTASRARVPLLLRECDYNRDHLTDLMVPSNYGPLLLSSFDTQQSRTAAVPHRTSAWSHGFYCAQVDTTLADQITGLALSASSQTRSAAADVLQYQYGTPFLTMLGDTAGKLYLVLSLLDPAMTGSLTGSEAIRSSAVTRVYRVTGTPLQRYYVHLADTTRSAVEVGAMAAWNATLAPSSLRTRWQKQQVYGALQVGAVHRFGWQDTHMKQHWAMDTQGARTVGQSLSQSRPLLGLGSTFSYVHDYTVGSVVSVNVTGGGKAPSVLKKQWPSYLVPNTQLFAAQEPAGEPGKWPLKLYLPTSQYRTLLLVSLTVILIVLGIPIACLRWGEIRSDYKEWNNRI